MKDIFLQNTSYLFPPNSRITGVRCSAAALITTFPILELPKIRKKINYFHNVYLTENQFHLSILQKHLPKVNSPSQNEETFLHDF